MQIPAYIISLKPPEMTTDLSNSLKDAGFAPEISPGIHGGRVPELVARLLTRNSWSVNHRGTLGCFISHVRTWETFLAADAEFALVVEDDAAILGSLDFTLVPEIAAADIVFCNERTSFPGSMGLRTLQPVMQFVEGHGRAIGGEGYFISKAGAAKLLNYVETDSLFSHVDLRMMVYALPTDWTLTHECSGQIANSIKILQREYSAAHRLIGFSMHPALVGHMQTPSRRAVIDIEFAVKETTGTSARDVQ